MKKIMMIAALAVAVASCSESATEQVATENLTPITLKIAGTEATTRVAADTSDDSKWTFTWEEDDVLLAYGVGDMTYFSISDYNEFTPTFSASVTSEMGGSFYLFYPSDDYEYFDLTYQDGTICPLLISAEPITTSVFTGSETIEQEVTMEHLGTFVNLNITIDFTLNNIYSTNYKLKEVIISSDDVNIPVKIVLGHLTTKDYYTPTYGSYTITPSSSYSVSQESKTISIPLNILPFTIASGKSIDVYVDFQDLTDVTPGVITAKVTKTNDTYEDITFERATINSIDVTFDSASIITYQIDTGPTGN